ncbi:hypothetical protein [Pontibacter sp. G13]|uniref:hypothetical protein n=1 Tax=Pontibacter sp. G13 TaxID=3074898 RepID=UPI00288A09FD|nr:hypothetical protein [Pontibacter sp. G13]WNJ16050.1 hypothetical protein RJD25_14400 [Pontibacter sp. G13]
METVSSNKAKMLGGNFALLFVGVGIASSACFSGVLHMAFESVWHFIAAGLIIPTAIFKLGQQVGLRVYVDREEPIVVGIMHAVLCLGLFASLIFAVDAWVLEESLMEAEVLIKLGTRALRTMILGLVPTIALGAIFGAHLGLRDIAEE